MKGASGNRPTLLSAIAVIAWLPGTNPLAAEDPPKRKPGLWEITTVLPVVGPKKVKVCIGANDDIAKPENAAGPCSQPKMTRSGDGVVVDVVCTAGEGKQTINLVFSEDFESKYHGVLKMTFNPPIAGMGDMSRTIRQISRPRLLG